MIISKENKGVIKGVVIFIILLGLQYTFLLEQTSFLYPYFFILVGISFIFFGYGETAKYLFSYLCYQILQENKKFEFVTKISREKWFFSIAGLIISIIGIKFLFNTSFLTFNSTHGYAIRNSIILFFIWSFSYVNNKFIDTFDTRREKFHVKDLSPKCQAIINKREFNLRAIFDTINGPNSDLKLFEGEYSSFEALIKLEKIETKEKINVLTSKAELAKFIYVLFDLKPEVTSEAKKELINHYFYKKTENEATKGKETEKDFILNSDASLTRINNSINNKDENFTNYKEMLESVFQRNSLL